MFCQDVGRYAIAFLGDDHPEEPHLSNNHLHPMTAADVHGMCEVFDMDWSIGTAIVDERNNGHYVPAIFWAARYGDEGALAALVPWMPRKVSTEFVSVDTKPIIHIGPLMWYAAAYGNIAALKGMLKFLKIDYFRRIANEFVFTTAVFCGQPEVVLWILDQNPSMTDSVKTSIVRLVENIQTTGHNTPEHEKTFSNIFGEIPTYPVILDFELERGMIHYLNKLNIYDYRDY